MTSSTGEGDSGVVVALGAVWAAIRREDPEVPPVTVTVGDTRAERVCQDAGNQWPGPDELAAYGHVLTVGPAVLEHGAAAVLEELLHAAAHGLAAVRGITETSRQGRYHNKRFAELAAELGLVAQNSGARGWDAARHGWAATELEPGTVEPYASELDRLSTELAESPLPEPADTRTAPRGGGRKIRALCACRDGAPIWASEHALTTHQPTCRICGQSFEPAPATSRTQSQQTTHTGKRRR